MRATEAVEPMLALLRRTDRGERAQVALALGRIVEDPDFDVQSDAAHALFVLGDPSGLAPPLAAHEREVLQRVMAVVRPLVDRGLASVETVRHPDDGFGSTPPCIGVRPTSPTACPITVQIDHERQVTLFMGEPTWCEGWEDDRDAYLDWIEDAVRAVVEGRYEEWVKPGTRQAKGVFHLPDGPRSFTDNLLRNLTKGVEHRVYTSYSGELVEA